MNTMFGFMKSNKTGKSGFEIHLRTGTRGYICYVGRVKLTFSHMVPGTKIFHKVHIRCRKTSVCVWFMDDPLHQKKQD